MNLVQQLGLLGLLGGGVLGFLRVTNAPLPHFPVTGGQLILTLPDDGIILALVVGGLVLLVLGSAWNVAHRRERGDLEEKDRDEARPRE
jgi:hypothetical protein